MLVQFPWEQPSSLPVEGWDWLLHSKNWVVGGSWDLHIQHRAFHIIPVFNKENHSHAELCPKPRTSQLHLYIKETPSVFSWDEDESSSVAKLGKGLTVSWSDFQPSSCGQVAALEESSASNPQTSRHSVGWVTMLFTAPHLTGSWFSASLAP